MQQTLERVTVSAARHEDPKPKESPPKLKIQTMLVHLIVCLDINSSGMPFSR